MKNLYENTLKDYLKILLASILAMFFAELLYGIFELVKGSLVGSDFIGYIGKKCILPVCINFAVYFGAKYVLESPDIKAQFKPLVAYGSLTAVCLVISLSHINFEELWGAFTLPILLASIFGKKEYIRYAVELSSLGVLITSAARIVSGLSKDEDIAFMVVNVYIAALLLVTSTLVAMLIRRFVESNTSIIAEQMENQETLKDRVKIDAMTGLINHTAFYDELDTQIRLSDRNNFTLCIAVVDIDNFKSVNDTYGHANGDKVIITLSDIMREVCKDHIVCRYGGEEFAVIFIGLKKKEAVVLMEEVLERFRTTEFEWCSHPITFSCGLCQHYDIRVTAEDLFMQADKYLYRAKRGGKNQVVSE